VGCVVVGSRSHLSGEVIEMKAVQSVPGGAVGRSLVAVAGVFVLALGSAAAGGAASGGRFCGVSKGVAKNMVNIQSQLQKAPGPAELKADYGAITSAEPALRASVPRSLKRSLNIAGLLPHMSSLQVKLSKADPAISRLKAYYRTTCKFDV
jgi:hypothetical protein